MHVVQEVDTMASVPPSRRARALYDCVGDTAEELTFHIDDVIIDSTLVLPH